LAFLRTVGAVPGSIIAAIMVIQTTTKKENEPSRVATPMSIPVISRMARAQHTAASPSVAASDLTSRLARIAISRWLTLGVTIRRVW
jgi:hypothetical protein